MQTNFCIADVFLLKTSCTTAVKINQTLAKREKYNLFDDSTMKERGKSNMQLQMVIRCTANKNSQSKL